MTYTIARGQAFNMVLSHIDRSDPATWVNKFHKEDVQNEFKGWDPRQVYRLWNLVVTAANDGKQAHKNHIPDQ